MATSETKIGNGAPRATPIPGLALVSNRYRVESLIGGGGCGLVYRAHRDGTPVAIKVLRPELVRSSSQSLRFFREARLAAQLHHTNIVDITDFGNDETSGAPYLVMELLEGKTLAAEMREHGAMPWRRAVKLLVQISRALMCAHAAGVIHRDLAPHNVVLLGARADRVKVCDFGLSRLRNGDSFVGTPAYMAPEQIRDGEQDERCDLYALGVLGFEMLTGSLPYRATSPVSLVSEILGGSHLSVRDRLGDGVPEPIVAILERCLMHEVPKRPASAADIEAVLAPLDEPEPAPPVTVAVATPVPEAPAAAAVVYVPPSPDLVGHTIGSYRVIAPLGVGGHSAVWLAEHPVIGTKVAIKVLRPEIAVIEGVIERFINEARATSLIASPHLARYLDMGTLPSGQPYAILEYLIGETVQERLERGLLLDRKIAISVIRQSASALSQAHALGIIHRDIKPGNIFLCEGETGPIAKVIDFGVAKLTGPAAQDDAAQSQHGFVGTTMYCAPEQIIGEQVTTAADVYALGVVLFELLTGHPPFQGDDLTSAKTTEMAPVVEDGPIPLSALVADMLALQPSDRPTMTQVMERLALAMTSPPAPMISPSATNVATPAPMPSVIVRPSLTMDAAGLRPSTPALQVPMAPVLPAAPVVPSADLGPPVVDAPIPHAPIPHAASVSDGWAMDETTVDPVGSALAMSSALSDAPIITESAAMSAQFDDPSVMVEPPTIVEPSPASTLREASALEAPSYIHVEGDAVARDPHNTDAKETLDGTADDAEAAFMARGDQLERDQATKLDADAATATAADSQPQLDGQDRFGELARRFAPKKRLPTAWIVAGVALATVVIFVLWSFSGSLDDARKDAAPPKATEAKVDSRSAVKADSNVDSKPESKDEPKVESKSDSTDGSKVDPKVESKAAAKADVDAETLAADKAAHEKAKADQLAFEKAEADKLAASKAEADKAAADKALADKAAADKAIADKALADKAIADKTAADKALADKAASDRRHKARQRKAETKSKSEGDVIIADPFK